MVKKILLSCAGGFSTSLLMNKMKDEAKSQGKEYEIAAVAADALPEVLKNEKPDCVLIGPQIKYMLANIASLASSVEVPVGIISMQNYGMMNGKEVLKQAEELMS